MKATGDQMFNKLECIKPRCTDHRPGMMAASMSQKVSRFVLGCNQIFYRSTCADKLVNTEHYFKRWLHNPRGWYEINLDKRKLRTPHGNVFKVPSEPLALAVATEWNAQEKVVNRPNMHLTERWGTVEWAHDIEKFDIRCRLAAAALFIHWCSESTSIKQKASLAPI
ncbi:hypothetical protein RRG08_016251 [Elysia crispata]|uniref:Uncharacterized protein n=1 Tax=Elysia crispata TaxID=231223 RepID=A0AAE1E0I6_9GAST|nr:hypothetical protein RRG08_016251 [Elysia crispata]